MIQGKQTALRFKPWGDLRFLNGSGRLLSYVLRHTGVRQTREGALSRDSQDLGNPRVFRNLWLSSGADGLELNCSHKCVL